MKVKIEFTVDIDQEAWELNYGTPRSQIRDDVRSYVEHGVNTQFEGLGVLAERGE